MKKSVLVSMAVLLCMVMGTFQSKAQDPKNDTKNERKALRKLEGTKVNDKVKTSFLADFGKIPDVQWKRMDTFDEVSFTRNGKKMKAWYDYDAKLVGTTSQVSFAEVPAGGQKEIKAKYKDYTVGPVVFFDDNEANDTDMILYGAQFDDADNYFVELSKGKDKIVVMIGTDGNVSFFKNL